MTHRISIAMASLAVLLAACGDAPRAAVDAGGPRLHVWTLGSTSSVFAFVVVAHGGRDLELIVESPDGLVCRTGSVPIDAGTGAALGPEPVDAGMSDPNCANATSIGVVADTVQLVYTARPTAGASMLVVASLVQDGFPIVQVVHTLETTSPDAGIDAAIDAPVDAPIDATVDAPVDAAVDADVDAELDADVDAVPPDAPIDGAPDA